MKNVAVRLLSLLGAGLPVLAGCAPSVSPIDVMANCPEMPLRGPEEYASAPPEAMIDDFESGDLKLTQIAGRMGSWVGVSSTPAATVFGEASSKCVARGTHSGHLTSSIASTPPMVNYPVNWNAVFVDPFSAANGWDASMYSGFSFWIAAGVNQETPSETPIGVTTVDTVMNGGVCSVPGGVCGDYYAIDLHKRIPLTHNWTRWVIKFDDLKQYGFGVPQVPLNRSKLVSLMIWPEPQFDIWIDDVRFEP
jgi:hypothetical protein